MEPNFIINYRELSVYQTAFENAMHVLEVAREFPAEEYELLTEPLIRASRRVCVCISEAWQKRRYQSAFIGRLNQAEAEVGEVQVWLEFAVLCSYLDAQVGQALYHEYQRVLTDLDQLIEHSAVWVIPVTYES